MTGRGELAVPRELGVLARAWDDQEVGLRAAVAEVGAAGTGGFSPVVAPAASAFGSMWGRLIGAAAAAAGARADGLRGALGDYLATDATAAAGHRLPDLTREQR